jgi:altronate dehydratase
MNKRNGAKSTKRHRANQQYHEFDAVKPLTHQHGCPATAPAAELAGGRKANQLIMPELRA